MSKDEVQTLIARGMPEEDARTALAAMYATPTGKPYGADAIRAAAILNPYRSQA